VTSSIRSDYRANGVHRRDDLIVGNALAMPAMVLIAAVAAYAAFHVRKARRARLRTIAARHGLEVDVTDQRPPDLGFALFDEGKRKKLSARMWRRGDGDCAFHYQYTVHSGDSSSNTRRFTCALIEMPFSAPHLTISTENWWSRARRVIGLRDVEVESPDFNDRYQVRCDDDRFAITLLDPPMIAWMLSPQSGRGEITFEYRNGWMLCYGARLPDDDLPGMLDWAQSIRRRLPAVLTDLYGR
jgi:hypothetical protein